MSLTPEEKHDPQASAGRSGEGRRGRVAPLLLTLLSLALVMRPGSAPGTVAEQRARLPPPATCQDPVEGVWKSHAYNPMYFEWTEFSLEIHRTQGSDTRLEGNITNHSWRGNPGESEPGPCVGALRYLVSMDAQGQASDGGRIEFGGVGTWRLDELICGGVYGGFYYNLDQFSGTIDPELQEFQSVNNDGGRSVNEPVVFRRIKCFEEAPAPHVEVAPPPFYPPESAVGCGVF